MNIVPAMLVDGGKRLRLAMVESAKSASVPNVPLFHANVQERRAGEASR